MPVTVNGIGTMYYGRKGLQTRVGVCEHCRHEAQLASYVTRLWLVVFFIPVIPLGRKKILDYCARCRWHRVTPLRRWEEIERQTTREAMERAEAEPDNPKAAIEMLRTLATFQRDEQADALARLAAEKHADDPEVQITVGSWHEHRGRTDEAAACFARAFELDPENPVARRAAGVACLERGELDRAREFLAFMEAPGPHHDPALLVLLADRYHAGGEHEKALEVYGPLLAAHPELARNRKLAARVRAAEQALGRTETILPPPRRRTGTWLAVATLAAALAAGALLWNGYVKRHQTLHVLNGLDVSVEVTIDGQSGCDVEPGEHARLSLAEGPHQAVARRSGGQAETIDFTIDNTIVQRFGQSSVFVLNFSGAADLLWQEAVYRADPQPGEGSHEIHFGKEFEVFRDIDYPFKDLPGQVKAGSGKSVSKRSLRVVTMAPAVAIGLFPRRTSLPELLDYAEHHLRLRPQQDALLQTYMKLAFLASEEARCRRFLGTALTRRPILVEWHRYYQSLAEREPDDGRLRQRYDQLVRECPTSAEALYLRARIEPDADRAGELLQQAIRVDPQCPYPYRSQAYHLVARGAFAEARPLAEKACQLAPGDATTSDLRREIFLALREYAALEQEIRAAADAQPSDLDLHRNLLRVLVASGQKSLAEEANESFARTVSTVAPEASRQTILGSQMALQYLVGDFQGYLASAEQAAGSPGIGLARAVGHLELGELEQAEQALRDASAPPWPLFTLLLSHAWRRRGNESKADETLRAAIEQFKTESAEGRVLAQWLQAAGGPMPEQLDRVIAQRVEIAATLVALASRHPDRRKVYLDRARQLNLPGDFPYQFLRRAIEEMGGK